MSNTATQTDFPLAAVLREDATTQGIQYLYGNIVPPLTSETETLSVTYTYDVLAESHQNSDAPDIVTGAGLANGAGILGEGQCENANFPQTTVTGDDESHTVGAHTVTVTYSCPAGHPLQTDHVQFGIAESQNLLVAQGTALHGTASSNISARWNGGTLTVGP
jgi:hypothetical protein